MSQFSEDSARDMIERQFPTDFPAGIQKPSQESEDRLQELYLKAGALMQPFTSWEILCWISDAMVYLTPYYPKPGIPMSEYVQRGVRLHDHLLYNDHLGRNEIIAILAGCLATLLRNMRRPE